ncbi:hypothetical protein [Brevirhabdus sp.]|uniref:hypothetical protein n=1 Tax=Brevirhabdus sp. TaxID=2004514 RepID=UPI00405838DE
MKTDAPPGEDWRDSCLQELHRLHAYYRDFLMQRLKELQENPRAGTDKDLTAVEARLVLVGKTYLKSLEEDERLEAARKRAGGGEGDGAGGDGAAFDAACARDEIGRRLAGLRGAADDGPLSGGSE